MGLCMRRGRWLPASDRGNLGSVLFALIMTHGHLLGVSCLIDSWSAFPVPFLAADEAD